MHDWVPEDLDLRVDVAPARWVEDRLRQWDRPHVLVGSYMPDVFDAYARVFHPAWRQDGTGWVTWGELGARLGVTPTAETAFGEVAGGPDHKSVVDGPGEGELEGHLMLALAAVLAPFTTTPEACWWCFWEGDGRFWSSAHALLTSGSAPKDPEALAAARRMNAVWEAAPRVTGPARGYFLFAGPLSVVDDLGSDEGIPPPRPNMWWPEDRAWFVSTEVDSISTYVGGSRQAIDAVLSSPGIEAVEARIDSRLDPRT